MRSFFAGHYGPTKEEFDKLWADCFFAFDTNMLLNCYRYTDKTRERFFEILDRLQDRVWLPYQVALEFHGRRREVIWGLTNAYSDVEGLVDKAVQDVEKGLGKYRRHPFIDRDRVVSQLKATQLEIARELAAYKAAHPRLDKSDTLLDKITRLFEKKVGNPYSETKLEQTYKEGKSRFEGNIPPGYEDAKGPNKKEPPDCYSDYVLWCQLIDEAKSSSRPLIFVTDDEKGDWWLQIHGENKGPRPELRQEFLAKAGLPFYMYVGDQFLQYAEKYLKLTSEPDVISEVREVRQQEEILEGEQAYVEAVRSLMRGRIISGIVQGRPVLGTVVGEVTADGILVALRRALENGYPALSIRELTRFMDNNTISYVANMPDDQLIQLLMILEMRGRISLDSHNGRNIRDAPIQYRSINRMSSGDL